MVLAANYPLLGLRVLAPIGITQAVATLLDHLPDTFRDSSKLRVFAPPHTHNVLSNKSKHGAAPPTRSIPTPSSIALPRLPIPPSALPFPHPKTPHGLPPVSSLAPSRSPFCYLQNSPRALPTMVTSPNSLILPIYIRTEEKLCSWIQTRFGFSATYPRSNNIQRSMPKFYSVLHPSSNTSPAHAIARSQPQLLHGNKPNLMTLPSSMISRPTLCSYAMASHSSKTPTSRPASWSRLLFAKLRPRRPPAPLAPESSHLPCAALSLADHEDHPTCATSFETASCMCENERAKR
jgi:hypothetical protein